MLQIPESTDIDEEVLLEGFMDYVERQGLTLYPAQEEAILEIFTGHNVILNTPTGSGKSLVALAMHYLALAEGRRCYYTAPIKALVSEKFFALCRDLGAENVGMMTGDASVNRDANIICCTAEILANLALGEGRDADVDYVVMDEFHYYSDRDRGVAWQIPLIALPQARFLLMSATMGETEFFRSALSELTDAPTALVKSTERPVPLDFEYRETPLHETIGDLLREGRQPIYVVHFTQRRATEEAQNLMSVDFLSKDAKMAIKDELKAFRFDSPFGKVLRRFVHHGVGVHHAGMLPKYRLLVEKLAQQGHLKVICGTDTLGVGVNIPIRTVLFTQLCKFDGEKTRVLSVRHFQQIAGRAGRRGFDDHGWVVAQAPEHEIENLATRRKAEGDAKKLRKMKLKKPPTKGYAHWDASRFSLLQSSEPEALHSSFDISHGMVLQLLSRREGGCAALKSLIRGAHEPRNRQRMYGRKAITIIRALREAGVITLEPNRIAFNEELQSDFSLNHSLSLYLLDALERLDSPDEAYAENVLSVVEAIQENPGFILRRQLDKLKTDTLNRLKAEGMEYDERMKVLDELEYPKPLREFIYDSYNEYARRHPWLGAENIRPKSVAREMYEEGLSFREYVKEYGLASTEGVLLRYLSNTYKSLVQNVPENLKTDDVYDICDWLHAVVHQVDSSLIAEWEALIDPEKPEVQEVRSAAAENKPELLRDPKRFEILVRNEVWRALCLVGRADYPKLSEFLEPLDGSRQDFELRLEAAFAPCHEDGQRLALDASARAKRNLQLQKDEERWSMAQTLIDIDGEGFGVLELQLDIEASVAEGRPVLGFLHVRF